MASVVNASGYGDVLRSSWKNTHIAGLATTVVKAAPGTFHGITINTKGSAATTITVYDNTAASGKVIAIIDPTTELGELVFDAECLIGITVVTAVGGFADITVLWV